MKHPVDIHVGKRIRHRRWLVGMTQQQLAEKVGIITDSTADLPNGLVRDIILTGRSLNAKRALASGLVQQMVARGEGERVALETARQLKKFDVETSMVAKQFAKPIPYSDLEIEKRLFLKLMDRPVVIEALKTFVESTETMPYLA